MRKIFLSIMLFSTASLTIAQENSIASEESLSFESKNGFNILPEKGDIALGITMSPVLNYVGNFFNGNTGNSAPNANFLTNPQISSNHMFAKYFLTDNSALRATLEFSGQNNFTKSYVQDDAAIYADPQSNAKAEDMSQAIGSTFIIGAGYEMRRGKSRVQGYYGGNVFFMVQNSRTEYTYANPFSELNPNPSTTDFGGNVLAADERMLIDYAGKTRGFGIGGLFGIECFIFPKVSLGAELAYSYIYAKTGQSRYHYEEWNVDVAEQKIETETPASSSNSWGTVNPSANFFLMFHF
jgi:hypothetical protein